MWGGVFFVSLVSLRAQPPLLVAEPKPGARWQVEIHEPRSHTKTARLLGKEENVLGEGVRKQTVFMVGSAPVTRYATAGLVLSYDPVTNEPVIETPFQEMPGGSLGLQAFPELAWVDLRWRVEDQSVEGRECDVYQAPWPPPAAKESPGNSRPSQAGSRFAVAYINKSSRLPVLYEDPLGVRKYTFLADQASLTLPADLLKAIKEREAAIRLRKQRFNIPQ